MDAGATYDDGAVRAAWAATAALTRAFDAPPPMGADPAAATRPTPAAVDVEAVVRAVTEQVCRQLGLPAR
jgi:hypothetical protein